MGVGPDIWEEIDDSESDAFIPSEKLERDRSEISDTLKYLNKGIVIISQ